MKDLQESILSSTGTGKAGIEDLILKDYKNMLKNRRKGCDALGIKVNKGDLVLVFGENSEKDYVGEVLEIEDGFWVYCIEDGEDSWCPSRNCIKITDYKKIHE